MLGAHIGTHTFWKTVVNKFFSYLYNLFKNGLLLLDMFTICKQLLAKSKFKKRSKKQRKPEAMLLSFQQCICKRVHFCKNWAQKYIQSKKKQGFGMIELLIVATIVSSFSAAGIVTFQSSQQRSRDSQRKADLELIATAYEEYYNDTGCYPTDSTYTDACGEPFRTYLRSMPCDPKTGEPYLYEPLENACAGYRLLAALENTSDPAIGRVGCDTEEGCGYGPLYTYGVGVGTIVYNADGPGAPATTEATPSPTPSPTASASPTPTPTPTAEPTPLPTAPPPPQYEYACDSAGICNQFDFGNPILFNCPVTYSTANCDDQCHIPALRCQF